MIDKLWRLSSMDFRRPTRFMALDIDINIVNYEYYDKVNRKEHFLKLSLISFSDDTIQIL